MKSSVELYWQRIAEKAGDTRTWNDLTPYQQHEIDGTLWGGDLDAAIDAARKQGGARWPSAVRALTLHI